MREKNICFSKTVPFAPIKSIFLQMITPFLFRDDRKSHMCAHCIFLTHSSVVEPLEWLASLLL